MVRTTGERLGIETVSGASYFSKQQGMRAADFGAALFGEKGLIE